MQIELIQTTTSDGVQLDGVLLPPGTQPPSSQAVDAVLIVHGSGGNFYRGGTLERAARISQAGFAVGVLNTRGHDVVASHNSDRFIGNAYDIFDECRFDLDASIGLLGEHGYSRICLLGVSIGAVKVAYYQALVQDPRVAAVIAFGPVRFSHSYFLSSGDGAEHQRNYEQAKSLVEAGHPDALMHVNFPNDHAIFSAEVYIDRHGPAERYNLLPMINDIRCPLLILAGTLENLTRHQDFAQDLFNAVTSNPDVALKLVEGATHGFPGMDDEFVDSVVQWTLGLRPAGVSTPANS